MNDLFNGRNVANASISEEWIQRIVTDSQEASFANFLEQLYKRGNINLQPTNNQRGLRLGQTNDDVSAAHHIHTHKDGSTWHLPEEYEWPQGTAQSLWNAWSTEDTVNKIPPLKFLKGADFGFMAGKVKRTPRRKFNDIKTLCKYIETQAANKGLETANLTIEEDDDIFLKIATEENCLKLPDGKRSVRLAMTLKKVRESRKLARQPQETNPTNPTEPSVNQDEEVGENEEDTSTRRNPATTRNTEMTTTPTVERRLFVHQIMAVVERLHPNG
ncbi:unnamed protein product [Cylindrotheca closterium]|uniref:Uncharacterized protein n=1 Tax=Cylindrotheca closterium TaxID=2856 RepID=A0AAD2FTX3_9STRA|nr:unnamed protein product [Cylindrotheca closterium]